MYNECLEKLARKAKWYNANCIVGLKVDFDEISGGGKSMFMINMVGTAVSIEDENGVISHEAPKVDYPDIVQTVADITGQSQSQKITAEDKKYVDLVNEIKGELWTMASAAESMDDKDFKDMYGADVASSVAETIRDYTPRFSELSRTIPSDILNIKSKSDLIRWSNN